MGITGGVRYTRDEKEFQGGQRDLNSLAFKLGYPLALHPNPNDPTLYFPTSVNHLNFSNVSFKAGINYQADRPHPDLCDLQPGLQGGWLDDARDDADPDRADVQP